MQRVSHSPQPQVPDVLCYGVICADELVVLDRPPAAGGYAGIVDHQLLAGGEALNTALALCAWGVSVRLLGNAIGADPKGRVVADTLATVEHLDARSVVVDPAVPTPYGVLLAAPDGTKTVLGRFAHSIPDLPAGAVGGCQAVTVDPHLRPHADDLVQQARGCGAYVLVLDALPDDPLSRMCDCLQISMERLDRCGRNVPPCPEEFVTECAHELGCTVILTAGERGAWYASPGGESGHQPALSINQVVDTTGAGDCFRAGLLYGWLRGWTLSDRVRFAAAAAARICCAVGGSVPPSLGEIDTFTENLYNYREM